MNRPRPSLEPVSPELDARLREARRRHLAGDLPGARSAYEQLLKTRAKHFESLNALGIIAAVGGDHKQALHYFERAVASEPRNVTAHLNRGLALQAIDAPDAALTSFEQAIAIDPGHAEAHLNLGNAQKTLNRLDDALLSYDRAIAINASYGDAYVNRGIVRTSLKQLDLAMTDFDRAIALNPNSAKAHANRACTELLAGNFARGWVDYEWRWKLPGRKPLDACLASVAPLWLGNADLSGKRILIYSEQGLGDTLQFCRYVPMVAALGADVMLAVPAPLAPLMTRLTGVSQLIAGDEELPRCDYQCPMLSLPLAFKTDADTIPNETPYLRADPLKVATWQERLGGRAGPRVGLVWNRGGDRRNDRNRSIALPDLLRDLPASLEYISLQKSVLDADRRVLRSPPRVRCFTEALHDFSDTAALCACMDLVVSIDTSAAHLAAGLGVETWIMLPFDAGWRWLLDRSDSPWYPRATLLRQEAIGDWAPVLEQVAERLRHRWPAS